jgi:hypothetical protein
MLAIGVVRSDDDRIKLDPDLRTRSAIAALFLPFAQAGIVPLDALVPPGADRAA